MSGRMCKDGNSPEESLEGRLSDTVGIQGVPGMSGPTGMTDFELKDGCWSMEYVELQGLCVEIINFMEKHPDLATKIEITRHSIKSRIR